MTGLARRRSVVAVLLLGLAGAGLAVAGYVWYVEGPRPPQVRADGFVAPSDWPDACTLVRPARRAGSPATARPGSLPDGTPLPAARSCSWSADGAQVRLDIKVVLRDVDGAFGGYRFGTLTYRTVDGLGDDAFLDSPTLQNEPEVLYVCKGHAIFTVQVEGLGRSAARDVLMDAGRAAVETLAVLPAGRRPAA